MRIRPISQKLQKSEEPNRPPEIVPGEPEQPSITPQKSPQVFPQRTEPEVTPGKISSPEIYPEPSPQIYPPEVPHENPTPPSGKF